MTIERLPMESDTPYSASEASIHAARYLLAKPFVKGKRVLDVACGEGYGSRLMRDWGAASVSGVDLFEPAIETATRLFAGDNVSFAAKSAYELDDLFNEGEFDVIVSLETIEHLDQPALFLQKVRKVAKADAVIIVSCPNDHWYYPEPEQGNEFHIFKYTLKEFQDLANKELGKAAEWGIGGPVHGFGSLPLADADALLAGEKQISVGRTLAGTDTLFIPQSSDVALRVENCSYFYGIWGGKSAGSVAVAPASMDAYFNTPEIKSLLANIDRVIVLETDQKEKIDRILELEGDNTGKNARIQELETYISRLEWRIKAHLIQEDIVAARFADLNATIYQNNLLLAHYRKYNFVIKPISYFASILPVPLKTLILGCGRTVMRFGRLLRGSR